MVALGVVGVVPDGHEIHQLGSKPQVEVLGESTEDVATDEDVEHTGDEGDLLTQSDRGRLAPLLAQSVHPILHAAAVFLELLICRWDTSLPFSHHSVLGVQSRGPYLLALLAHLLPLHVDRMLPPLKSLGELDVVQQVEDGQLVERRKCLPVLLIRAAVGEGRVPRQFARRTGRRVEVILLHLIEEGGIDLVHAGCDARRGRQRFCAHDGVRFSALARAGVLHQELLLKGEDGRTVSIMRIRSAKETTKG